MKVIKIYIISLLIIKIFSQCTNYNFYDCLTDSEKTYQNYNERKFQTPANQDTINHKSTYQGMYHIVGYPKLTYSADRKSCHIEILINENSKTSGSKLLYTFGDKEQQENSITITSSSSYLNGMPISVRLLDNFNKEIAKLEFENEYFLWDNPIINKNDEYENGQKGVIVELFGWPYDDIAEECVFLGIAGYLGVKVYPPYESILSYENVENEELNPWNYFYQPVSYKLNSRMGDKKLLKKMINICRKNEVRVYTDTIINHMTKDGNDMYQEHKNSDCSVTWGEAGSSGGSPFWTVEGQYKKNSFTDDYPSFEFPAVPYFMNHFHCKKDISDTDGFLLTTGWVNNFIDLNTELDEVRQRIADYFTELISIGFSGFSINFAKYVAPNDYAEIFKKLKINLGGGEFPDDLIIYLELEIDNSNKELLFCGNGQYSFGTPFTSLLNNNGLSNNDINKIKIWAIDYPSNFPICGDLKINEERYIIGLDYLEDQNINSIPRAGVNIYIKSKNIESHKNALNTMLTNKIINGNEYNNIKIKTIFSSYSFMDNGASGIPDGRSDCKNCTTNACKNKCKKSVPYQKAYNMNSKGYDTGDNTNWKEGSYTRVHRDKSIVNSMRNFMGLKSLTETELYETEKYKADQTEDCDIKCSLCSSYSKKNNLCLYCNTNKGYFPVIIDDYQMLYECINPSINTEGYYYNSTIGSYRPCYETCKTCSKEGNPYNHNCDSCDRDLIFRPEDYPNKNCVTNCSGYYYFNVINLPRGYTGWSSEIQSIMNNGIHYNKQYKCTANRECLKDVPYHIKDKRKCIDDCKNDDTYKYRYNSYCLSECPPNTYNDNFLCKDIDTNECILSNTEIEYLSFGNDSGVDVFGKNYAGEYNYTDKHISQYKNSKYTVTLYKNSDCITGISGIKFELELGFNYSFPYIDFGNCYNLVKDHYGIDEDLIVAVVENNILKNPYTSYAFFDPRTGEKLNASTICANENITVYENITALIENLPNFDLMKKMLEQGINIFDPKDPFYTDICYPYDAPEKKDISLEDRLLIYFPNISLCDEGCQMSGLDLYNMTAICDCSFQDITSNSKLTDNALFEKATGDIFDKIAESNIYVLKCYKYIFKYLTRSYGFFIFLVLLLIHIVSVIIYCKMELDTMMKYIFTTTQNYLSFISNKNKEKVAPPKKNDKPIKKKLETKSEVKTKNKRKKPKLYQDLQMNLDSVKGNDEESKHNNSFHIFKKNNKMNSKEIITPSVNSEQMIIDDILSKKKNKKKNNNIKNKGKNKNDKNKKVLSLFKATESHDILETIQIEKEDNKNEEKSESESGSSEFDFDEYLSTPPDEMDYDDAIKLDERKYCEFFADNLKERVLIANTFFEQEPLKPITLKIMVFILTIVFYFVINGFFFNEEYISILYHLENDKFFDFIPRSLKRFLSALIIGEIIEYITEFFFIEEQRIKSIFTNEKDNILNIKNEIIEIINGIKRRNLAFIIVVFILFIFFLYYVLCFNYVYHYSQIEWIKSSIFIFLLNQLLSILLSFLETSFRFLAFSCESERLYQFSQIFN